MAIDTKYKIRKGSLESLTSLSRLDEKDLPLIQRVELNTAFVPSSNRLDVFFYSLDGRFLSSIVDSKNYSVIRGGSDSENRIQEIILNPEKDSTDGGYTNGDVNVLYNFINNLFSETNTQPHFFIEAISSDRTEIRALSNEITDRNIVRFVDLAKSRLEDSTYFEDFRLNLGKNKLLLCTNINRVAYKNSQAVIIKLYQPLPPEVNLKDVFTLEELVGDSVLYEVVTEVTSTELGTFTALRGPNYDIELVEENNNPTGFLNYEDLFSYPVTNSYYEVYSLFSEKGAQISIDHTDFAEFIHFSSAEERIRNFYYKASLLETYRNQISSRTTFTGSIEDKITGIINNFDHYDRFLYYETGSFAWPKSNSTRPLTLYSTGSTQVQSWYAAQIESSSLYDLQNGNRLINSIPSFIREDSNNAPYSLFVDMIGQHFDNLWIYSKAVTDKYNADNRLNFGISKDLVRDAVESFGISLYNNNESLENLFSAFTGETYNSGSEQISSLIVAVEGSGSLSGSAGNQHLQPMPKTSYQKEVYKRIYHNVPLLLKSKGTERGLRALINTFGIPSDVLKIKTFGGGDNSVNPFYGGLTEVTSSLGKIRTFNSDGVVTGDTLSNLSSVVNYGEDYSTDIHTVEVGFSPADNLDNYIRSHPSMSSFNLDEYIGDPGAAYSSSYSSLNTLAETVFTSGSSYVNVYNAFDFTRLIKFFDNSIFRILKDFLPARSNISTGIIIKPHLLNRSKVKQPQVEWSNQTSPGFLHSGTQLDYTGSFYTTNFSIDGNIRTAFMSGSNGLDTRYTASYTENYALPSGSYYTLSKNNHNQAFYTGEFSGSIVTVSNGDLNADNTFRKLDPLELSFKYIPRNDFSLDTSIASSAGELLTILVASSSIDSPTPQDGTGTPIELSIQSGSYTTEFRLTGGPNRIVGSGFVGGTPVLDSGSVEYTTSDVLGDKETLLIDLTVNFSSTGYISPYPDDTGLSKVQVDLIVQNTVVDTVTFQRSGTGFETDSYTLQYYNNTGGNLDGTSSDYYYRVTYISNLYSIYSQDFIDASLTFDPRRLFFDADAVTVWLEDKPVANYTSSFIKAVSIPINSTTNGYLKDYIAQADEIVFEYPSFKSTQQYSDSLHTSSISGGGYKAATSIENADINLTHITSAPYTFSGSKQIQDIDADTNVQLKFTADFQDYWSTYLNSYNFESTPYISASIRDRDTKVVTGDLQYFQRQGQYPNQYKVDLSYKNDTGTAITNQEFFYEIRVPKVDKGAGFPKVNIKNIAINYRLQGDRFVKSKVLASKKLPNTFYLDLLPDVEVFSGSLPYFETTPDYYKFGLIPGEDELFRFNDFAATSNNIDSLRKSNVILKVDEKTYTPTQGTYKGFFLPSNYQILAGILGTNLSGLDERLYAEVQDSNYYSTGWINGRYEGTETTNFIGGVPVLGKEPALTYDSFKGSFFVSGSDIENIKTKFSGSEIKEGDIEVYYTSFGLQGEEGTTLSNVSSIQTNASVITLNNSTFSIDITQGTISNSTYSGSLGISLEKNESIVVDANVTLTDIDSDLVDDRLTVNLKRIDTGDIIDSQVVDGTTFTVGSTTPISIALSMPNNLRVADAILEFDFDNLEANPAESSTNLTLSIISINKNSLLPLGSLKNSIVQSSGTGKTILYEQVRPTPTSPNGFNPLVTSKIYRFDNNLVYVTNDKGVVIDIQ